MDLRIKLENLMKGDKLEPFIKHIRFPHFKNLTPKLKIEFKYPITALVGPNGSNKSSILRAIACCPHYENLQEYWFETDVDPIDESRKLGAFKTDNRGRYGPHAEATTGSKSSWQEFN